MPSTPHRKRRLQRELQLEIAEQALRDNGPLGAERWTTLKNLGNASGPPNEHQADAKAATTS
jgi:hypothetical protein